MSPMLLLIPNPIWLFENNKLLQLSRNLVKPESSFSEAGNSFFAFIWVFDSLYKKVFITIILFYDRSFKKTSSVRITVYHSSYSISFICQKTNSISDV